MLWDDKPDSAGYNTESFDQNHELWRASSPLVMDGVIMSPVHNDFKNADTTYFRALSLYLDHRINFYLRQNKASLSVFKA
jgi:hypothetical protein